MLNLFSQLQFPPELAKPYENLLITVEKYSLTSFGTAVHFRIYYSPYSAFYVLS